MMSKNNLGRLEKVDLRNAWSSESSDFTPWLAEPENLDLLGQTIGMELELEAQEKFVGPFRADILCKDIGSSQWVLIENQLERTDHIHLGQLLTYAAGLNAVTIVWIAERFTEEHRAALDWLNAITDENINFFGLEIELWRIGDSLMAPKFNVISKPNNWSKTVSQRTKQMENSEHSETKQLQLEYWTNLKNLLQQQNSSVHIGKPRPQHWMYFSLGRAGFLLIAFANTREKRIGVGLVLSGPNSKAHYYLLQQDRAKIESEIGIKLDIDWRENPDKIESHLYIHARDMDPTIRDLWLAQHEWMREKLEVLKKVFVPRIKMLNANEYKSDEIMLEN